MDQTDSPASIWVHLEELRRRLLIAVVAMVLTTVASFAFAERFMRILAQPIGGLEYLQAIEVTETIGVYMRVSLLGGFILALPVLLYEIIAFTLPGLNPNEKRWLFMAIPFATFLFIAGVAFAFYVMLPTAIPFLTGFVGVKTVPRVANYINFVTSLLFWIGVAFETPLLVFALVKLKIVSVGTLARQWRIAIVVIAALSAVITPTVDPVNMGLLMLPLFGLYLLSLLLGLLAR